MSQFSAEKPYVFLNPDGTQEAMLHVLVLYPTGVQYAHQCGGFSTETRVGEGFLVPLGGPIAAGKLTTWFWKTFQGNSYLSVAMWENSQMAKLKEIVAAIPCWQSSQEDDDLRFLSFDESRLAECTEGWVPVETPYGPGILIFPNSD